MPVLHQHRDRYTMIDIRIGPINGPTGLRLVDFVSPTTGSGTSLIWGRRRKSIDTTLSLLFNILDRVELQKTRQIFLRLCERTSGLEIYSGHE